MPGVLECGVVGVHDDKSGEAVKVVIVRKDMELTKEAIVEHCRLQLTAYKVPRHVEFRDVLAEITDRKSIAARAPRGTEDLAPSKRMICWLRERD